MTHLLTITVEQADALDAEARLDRCETSQKAICPRCESVFILGRGHWGSAICQAKALAADTERAGFVELPRTYVAMMQMAGVTHRILATTNNGTYSTPEASEERLWVPAWARFIILNTQGIGRGSRVSALTKMRDLVREHGEQALPMARAAVALSGAKLHGSPRPEVLKFLQVIKDL